MKFNENKTILELASHCYHTHEKHLFKVSPKVSRLYGTKSVRLQQGSAARMAHYLQAGPCPQSRLDEISRLRRFSLLHTPCMVSSHLRHPSIHQPASLLRGTAAGHGYNVQPEHAI